MGITTAAMNKLRFLTPVKAGGELSCSGGAGYAAKGHGSRKRHRIFACSRKPALHTIG